MQWENPEILLLWWLLPIGAALYYFVRRRHRAVAERFADQSMLPRLLPAGSAVRHWSKVVLLLLALGCLIAGAARPRWGVYFEEVQSRGVDMFVLLDVSRSMLAEDAVKAAIRDYSKKNSS